MKKEAKRKARIEQRRAKRSSANPKESDQEPMHDINKPITLEDLTNPDKIKKIMKSFEKKDLLFKKREAALKFKKRKKNKLLTKNKNVSTLR